MNSTIFAQKYILLPQSGPHAQSCCDKPIQRASCMGPRDQSVYGRRTLLSVDVALRDAQTTSTMPPARQVQSTVPVHEARNSREERSCAETATNLVAWYPLRPGLYRPLLEHETSRCKRRRVNRSAQNCTTDCRKTYSRIPTGLCNRVALEVTQGHRKWRKIYSKSLK